MPVNPNIPLPETFKEKNPLVAELIKLSTGIRYEYQTIDATGSQGAINAFSRLYASLLHGAINVHEFAAMLDDAGR